MIISGAGVDEDFWLGRADAWKEANPQYSNVTFSFSAIGDDVVDSTVADWTSSTSPDVFGFASDKIQPLYSAGALAEVPDDYASWMEENMSAGAYSSAEFAGSVLAYPWTPSNGYYLYYDKTKLSANDVSSWESLEAAAEAAGEKIGYPVQSTPFYSVGVLSSFGAGWDVTYDDDGNISNIEATFDTEEGFLGGKAVQEIMTSSAWVDTQQAPTEDNGYIATVNGPWALSANSDGTASAYDSDDIGIATLPTITVTGSDGNEQSANLKSFLGTKLLGVNRAKNSGDTAKLTAAHSLAYYMVNEDSEKARFDYDQSAPAITSLLDDSEISSNKSVAAISAQADHSIVQAALPANIWTAPATFTAAIADGTVSTDQQIKDALETMNETLESVD